MGWLSFRNDAEGRALAWDGGGTAATNGAGKCWTRKTSVTANSAISTIFLKNSAACACWRTSGANLAPWNVAAHRLALRGGQVVVDGRPLIFFHFHGIGNGCRRAASSPFMCEYRAPLAPLMREGLYRPYLRELVALEAETRNLLPANPTSLRQPFAPAGSGWVVDLRAKCRILLAYLRGHTVTLS